MPQHVLLYDGVCGLCNRTVRFLLWADRKKRFAFAPLQGSTAAELRGRHPEIPDELESFVYVVDERVYLRSRAILAACGDLPFPWWLAKVWLIIPRPISDAVYNLVARVRYKLFGKYDACPVPRPEHRARFLP